MTALQKVNLGTAPAGSDGDAVRTAFVKDNANVDVLNSQTCLTSATLITTAQALTTAHIGKRVNINLSTAGTINLPAASACAVDQVTLLRNTGTTVVTLAITSGSGDTVSVSKLNPGEAALMDTDGVHTWTCLIRGRTNSDNETVNGNCTVNGNETVGGTLIVTGATTLTGGLTSALPVASGGTGATTKAVAQANLGVGKVLLSTANIIGANRVAFALPSGYDLHEIEIGSVTPSGSGSEVLGLAMSSDGGATWLSSANYNWVLSSGVVGQTTANPPGTGNALTYFTLSGGVSGGTSKISYTLKLRNFLDGRTFKHCDWFGPAYLADNQGRIVSGMGHYWGPATVINAVSIWWVNGATFAGGTMSLYAVNK